MHRELMSCVYICMMVLYFSVDDFSAPFDDRSLAFRVYMTVVGVCMLFELMDTGIDPRPLFLLMQWSSYALCGFHNLPYWMVAYAFYVCICKILKDAEQRVAALDRLVINNGLHFENLHQLSNEKLKLAVMTDAHKKEMKTLNEFRKLRKKGEVPLRLTYHEQILWDLSDNKGLVYTREKRRWITLALYLNMWILYVLWWHNVSWYTMFDALMFMALVQNDKTTVYIFYHLSFVFAILYARHKPSQC